MITPTFIVVTLSALAYFTAYASQIPTLPVFVQDSLGGGGLAVGLTVGAFGATALAFRPFAGRIADRRGRKMLIVGGAGLVGLTVLAYVPANTVWLLIVLRLIAGIGEAMFFVGAIASINDIAPPERRGEAVSLFSTSLYVGVATGPIVGETIQRSSGFDAVWLVTAGLAFVSMTLAMLARETYTPVADAPRARLLHPAGLVPGLIMLTSVWGFAGYMAFVRLYADDLRMSGAGGVLAMYGSIMVAIRLFGARLPDVLGPGRAGLIGLSLSASGLAIVGFTGTVPGLFMGTVMFAMGQALAFPAFMSMAAGGAPPAERGAAIGTITAFIDLGFTAGPVSLGVIASRFDNRATFLGGAAIAAVGVIGQVIHGRLRKRSTLTTSSTGVRVVGP